ncbi:hypothetical protein FKO01_46835 [Mesorhizobium sp. B2-3-3]|nr:hypothetical protein FKO01_46835 [Mesorhizobium sp. B2-3-3]
MDFRELSWSGSEKKVARRAYDAAVEVALARIMAEFKGKASAVATPAEMWEVEDYLRAKRREFDDMFDYRYSQLLFVFPRLIQAGYLNESALAGLAQDKLESIRETLAFFAKRSVQA